MHHTKLALRKDSFGFSDYSLMLDILIFLILGNLRGEKIVPCFDLDFFDCY